jgi:predicted GIY-YIG superfamily endonuclease
MGCIYLLYDDDGNGYIGKTINIKQRLRQHKQKIDGSRSRFLNNFECLEIEAFDSEDDLDSAEQFYYDLYKDLYGDKIVNCKRPLQQRKEYYENNKERLSEEQKEWREKNKEQIAEQKKEYYKINKEQLLEKQKEYSEKNKERIKEKEKEWYKINKERLLEKQKEYNEKNKERIKEWRENNKEQVLEYKKEWYENNKAKIAEQRKQKITCECGSVINYAEKTPHAKTKKHQNYLSNNN